MNGTIPRRPPEYSVEFYLMVIFVFHMSSHNGIVPSLRYLGSEGLLRNGHDGVQDINLAHSMDCDFDTSQNFIDIGLLIIPIWYEFLKEERYTFPCLRKPAPYKIVHQNLHDRWVFD